MMLLINNKILLQDTKLEIPPFITLIYWAQKRGHLVTQDLKSPVDVIVLSGRSDFAKVPEYQSKAPVIIDLIDGYLGNENPIVDLARGLGKIGTSQLSGKPKRYSSVLSQAITQANATICAAIGFDTT